MSESPPATLALQTLLLAHEHVRARTRSPRYFQHGDRFASAYLDGPLGIATQYYMTAGTDVPAILDTCYEHLLPAGAAAAPVLQPMTARLQEATALSAAAGALPALRAAMKQSACSFLDVACALLSANATLGHAALVQKASAGVADDWLSLWRDCVWKHNHQQQIHAGLCLLPPLSVAERARVQETLAIAPAELHPRATTFEGGVTEYLTAFGDTAAAAVALVGVLPFTEKLNGFELAALIAFLAETPELLTQMNGMLRLAQDVRFDPSEPLSAGVLGLAAERGVSLAELEAAQLAGPELEAKLQKAWRAHAREARAQMEAILVGLPPGGALHRTLTEVVGLTCHIADALVSAPHKTEG